MPLGAYTMHFADAVSRIQQSGPSNGKSNRMKSHDNAHPKNEAKLSWESGVILDGGPHTAWYSTQRPDGGRGARGYDVIPNSSSNILTNKTKQKIDLILTKC